MLEGLIGVMTMMERGKEGDEEGNNLLMSITKCFEGGYFFDILVWVMGLLREHGYPCHPLGL